VYSALPNQGGTCPLLIRCGVAACDHGKCAIRTLCLSRLPLYAAAAWATTRHLIRYCLS